MKPDLGDGLRARVHELEQENAHLRTTRAVVGVLLALAGGALLVLDVYELLRP